MNVRNFFMRVVFVFVILCCQARKRDRDDNGELRRSGRKRASGEDGSEERGEGVTLAMSKQLKSFRYRR